MARFDEFWEVICAFKDFLRIGFVVMVFFVVLSTIALLLAEPGTGSYLISIVNFALSALGALVLAGMNRVCGRREMDFS